ncbi:branched-chain amino acid ABC transporter permease [Bdellovibrio sp. HCB2-146]|uniref:branched-chain amino acid ABC transporter permease n=1 Tax=Bdellovibrio sp. HCB2-146 TaxID=3394362 RepID=UPI0039BD0950
MRAFKNPVLALIALALLGLVFDFGFNAYIQLMALFVAVNCLMSMSLNLVNGYTGQFSLGHAGFMALGAYFTAFASNRLHLLPESIRTVELFAYVCGGGIVAAFAGLLVGLPSLRLKGDYLAIVTLGFGEIIRVALLNMDTLGGPRGFSGIPSIGPFLSSFLFASIWLLICFFTIWRLMGSSYGRGFLSVREDEIAAEAMGVNTTQMKVKAFVLSSFFAGVAGGLFAFFTNFINPSSFGFLTSVNAVIMVVLGGMGSMTGSIVGAIIVTILPELLRPLQDLTGVDLRMVIYSLSLILVMILRPQGLFGGLEISDLWRKYVKRSS